MHDPRTEKVADLMVNYSLGVQPGQRVMIQGALGGEPLMAEISKKVIQAGAFPMLAPYYSEYFENIYRYANPENFDALLQPLMDMVKTYDHRVFIYGENNTKFASQFDPAITSKYSAAASRITDIMLKREAKGDMHWVLSLFPTNAYAQDAGMSLRDYEDFVYNAILPDPDDPVAYWNKVKARQDKIIAWLKGKQQVHVTAPGTDLTLSIAGRPFINCSCRHNVPDGEVFTSPVENSANGHVHFTYPTLYQGYEVTNVRLEFKDGKVVSATADKNQDFLLSKLDTDPGARFLGEFAIGTNEGIDRFTGNILFDEKIGGSFHLAVGHGYPEAKTQNESAIHWDMICDLRNGGQITVDGELFYKNGEFVIDF
jgi:aminopeptidase